MNDVEELRRLPAPAPKPHGLAFDGPLLWMSSVQTGRILAIDTTTWTSRDEAAVPGLGKAWGITVVGDQLRVTYGLVPGDDRVIGTLIPGHGFRTATIPCPEATGSQLSFDGDRLYVSQWYNRRIIALDERGTPGTVVAVPHGIAGHVVIGGRFYALTTDDEEHGDYWLTRIDARGAEPVVRDLARVPFRGRSLAWDGTSFWSAHREADAIVAFAPPAGAFD